MAVQYACVFAQLFLYYVKKIGNIVSKKLYEFSELLYNNKQG